MKKLAVFFPGIGYTVDKPLLHFSRKIARNNGYEELCIGYHDLPGKIRGDKAKMTEAYEKALPQAEEQLIKADLSQYDEIVFFAKSIGTVVATHLADKLGLSVKMVLFTPVEATFNVPIDEAIGFYGTDDPWSDFKTVVALAKERNVPLWIYENCNHSLESDDMFESLDVLTSSIMKVNAYI